MPQENKLKGRDMGFILINLLIYRLFTDAPLVFSKTAGSAASISASLSVAFGFLITLLLAWLLNRFCGGSLLDAIRLAFGNLGRRLAVGFILAYLFISSIVMLKEFSEFTKLLSFPSAPLCFTAVFFILGAWLSARCGLTVIGRLHCILVPIIIFVFIFIVISTLWDSNFLNLFPLLGKGLGKTVEGGFSGLIMYTDILLFGLILPKNFHQKSNLSQVLGYSAIGFILVLAAIFAYAVKIPYPTSAEASFPSYLLLKEIYYGKFLQRIDAIFLIAGVFSGILYLGLCLYFMAQLLKDQFNLSDSKPTFLPISLCILFAALGGIFIPPMTAHTFMLILGFGTIFWGLVSSLLLFKRRNVLNEKA